MQGNDQNTILQQPPSQRLQNGSIESNVSPTFSPTGVPTFSPTGVHSLGAMGQIREITV